MPHVIDAQHMSNDKVGTVIADFLLKYLVGKVVLDHVIARVKIVHIESVDADL